MSLRQQFAREVRLLDNERQIEASARLGGGGLALDNV